MQLTKKMPHNKIQIVLVGCFMTLMYIYYGFVIESPLIYGQDLQYRPNSYINQINTYLPQLWESYRYGGYTTINGGLITSAPVHYLAVYLSKLTGMHYNDIGIRLLWFVPFFLFAFVGIYKVFKEECLDNRYYMVTLSFYLFNPAIVSRVYRGQLGLMVAYALIPWLLIYTKKFLVSMKVETSLIYAILITISLSYDIRITLLTIVVSYAIYLRSFNLAIIKKNLLLLAVLFLLNFYWVYPVINNLDQLIPPGLQQEGVVNHNSYIAGNMVNSLSLTPKIWGNQIFPSSLILAFVFYFLFYHPPKQHKKNKMLPTIGLALLVLFFLGKGGYPPVGDLFSYIMDHVPLANMYRVPNKFWMLVPILIILMVSPLFRIDFKCDKLILFSTLTMVYLLSSGYGFLNLYSNNYKPDYFKVGGYPLHVKKDVPYEYEKLWSYIKSLNADKVLWLPDYFTYSFADNTTSAMYLRAFFRSPQLAAKVHDALSNNDMNKLAGYLRSYNVSAVVVLDIFRPGSAHLYKKFDRTSEFISGYKSVNSGVFLVPNTKKMISIVGEEDLSLSYKKLNDVEYKIKIPDQCTNKKLIFVQSFDNSWFLDKIKSNHYLDGINSFLLDQKLCGKTVRLHYKAQSLLEFSMKASVFFFVFLFLYLLYSARHKFITK